MMVAAILAAVVLYTFIGFIPGTDETGVLAPVTLAIILAGAPPHVVLAFFISAVVTLNLMNGIPTALVGLPGGVMSAPLMDHAMVLRTKGLASDTIRKMAVGSAIGTLISIPLSFLLASLLLPMADWIKTHSDIVLAAGAVVLALLGKNRILSLVSILPMALLFQALPALYRGAGIIPEKASVNTSFFLGITVGPMLLTLLELLNAKRREELPHGNRTKAELLRSGFGRQALRPGRLITRSEGWWSAAMAAASTPLFILSPVGLTFLLGEASEAGTAVVLTSFFSVGLILSLAKGDMPGPPGAAASGPRRTTSTPWPAPSSRRWRATSSSPLSPRQCSASAFNPPRPAPGTPPRPPSAERRPPPSPSASPCPPASWRSWHSSARP